MNSKKILTKADSLSTSLDELEDKLQPILSQTLQESTASLDKLQQAKLNVLLPYLLNDLIFIYLRTKGVDPKSHPVVAELDRVRQYFSKIRDAEEAEKKRASIIDKAAAGRFIKYALVQARQNADSSSTNEASPSQPSTLVPVRVTEKMRERENYLRNLEDESDSEDVNLEFIGNDTGAVETRVSEDTQEKPKSEGKKRRRPMDPFASLADNAHKEAGATPGIAKKSKKLTDGIDEGNDTSSRGSSALADGESRPNAEKLRKKKKKFEKTLE